MTAPAGAPGRAAPGADAPGEARVAATVVVRTLGELVDHATPDVPDPVTGRRRDSGVYRGVGDARWPLLTSLDRLGGTNPPHTKRGLEEHVLRNFARYSRPYLGAAGEGAARSDWELLAAAQHHGVPTRLLDWTYSPLVAAHFATLGRRGDAAADEGTQGGGAEGTARVIYRLDWLQVHRHFGLPERALLTGDLEALRPVPGAPPGSAFTPWVLAACGEAVAPFACVFEPPTLDARIAAQAAVLTLTHTSARGFDLFLAEHGLTGALTRYVIPAGAVARVRDQLDLASFDERRLFPDLDGVAARLRRYYS